MLGWLGHALLHHLLLEARNRPTNAFDKFHVVYITDISTISTLAIVAYVLSIFVLLNLLLADALVVLVELGWGVYQLLSVQSGPLLPSLIELSWVLVFLEQQVLGPGQVDLLDRLMVEPDLGPEGDEQQVHQLVQDVLQGLIAVVGGTLLALLGLAVGPA